VLIFSPREAYLILILPSMTFPQTPLVPLKSLIFPHLPLRIRAFGPGGDTPLAPAIPARRDRRALAQGQVCRERNDQNLNASHHRKIVRKSRERPSPTYELYHENGQKQIRATKCKAW